MEGGVAGRRDPGRSAHGRRLARRGPRRAARGRLPTRRGARRRRGAEGAAAGRRARPRRRASRSDVPRARQLEARPSPSIGRRPSRSSASPAPTRSSRATAPRPRRQAVAELGRGGAGAAAEHDVCFLESDIDEDGARIVLVAGAPRVSEKTTSGSCGRSVPPSTQAVTCSSPSASAAAASSPARSARRSGGRTRSSATPRRWQRA